MQNISKVEKINQSEVLLFSFINDAKDLLRHHWLLIARHYIYTCKQKDTGPNVQMWIQIVRHSVEIERPIATKDRCSVKERGRKRSGRTGDYKSASHASTILPKSIYKIAARIRDFRC